MLLLVDCSSCHTPLQLPPGAQTIRCALCHAVTRIASSRALPPPPYSSSSSSSTHLLHPLLPTPTRRRCFRRRLTGGSGPSYACRLGKALPFLPRGRNRGVRVDDFCGEPCTLVAIFIAANLLHL
ncbi:hypothetical protein COP1_041736 [Malus domestica]